MPESMMAPPVENVEEDMVDEIDELMDKGGEVVIELCSIFCFFFSFFFVLFH